MRKVVLILIIFFIFTSCAKVAKMPPAYENLLNKEGFKVSGKIYSEKDWLYFKNYYDNNFYRVNNAGKIIHKISNEKNIIKVMDNNIYFSVNGILCRKNLNTGENFSYHLRGEVEYINNLFVVFLAENEKYCLYDFATQEIKELSREFKIKRNNLEVIDFEDEWLYFINSNDDNKIYKINIKDNSTFKLTDDKCDTLKVSNGVIYYTNASDSFTLYRIDINGENRIKLNDIRYTFYFEIYNNMIFYSNYADESRLYKMDLYGNCSTKISNDKTIHFCIYDNNIYYNKMIFNTEIDSAKLKENLPHDKSMIDEINSIHKINIDGNWLEKIL